MRTSLLSSAILGLMVTVCLAQPKSLDAIGVEGREQLRVVGRGYGASACAEANVQSKEEIKGRAWGDIRNRCVTFSMRAEASFSDDPSRLYSLCIGAALEACQRVIGVAEPCRDLASCRKELGVP
jgi:hypothetical protein